MKSYIAKKLILYIILFSSFLTLLITAIQLYIEFQYDVKGIHQKLAQVQTSDQQSITQSVWLSDKKQLKIIIDGITALPDIVFAKVSFSKGKDIVSGDASIESQAEKSIKLVIPLQYEYNSANLNIGEFTVIASLSDVYSRMINRLGIILLSNALKTSLVALFIYFIFVQLVTRHLTKISNFTEQHDPLLDSAELSLDRSNTSTDEFDFVVDSINAMHHRLKEQMSEIAQQKEYLSQTLNSIGDAVITTDNKGNVTRLNPVAEQLTGWSSSEALTKPLKSIFPIVDASTRNSIENPVDKVLSTGETIYLSNHTTLISKNGREYQIADSAAPIRDGENILGMVLVFNDVTEQYKIREELKENEKSLRMIHSQVPSIVYQFRLDTEGKKHLPYVSPTAEKYLGVTAAAVMADAEKWFELTHPDDYPGLEKSIMESMENLTVWEWEGRFIRKDGKIVWLRGTSSPERLNDGSTLWNGVFIDITERVEADDAIRRSQKMDALGKLTGGIAHDYNNILGVVLGYADLLTDELEEQPQLKRYAEKIYNTSERGAQLTKKLLAFSKSKFSAIEILNINSVLTEEKDLLAKTLTARIHLELKLDSALWSVSIDESELVDAILNLTINAMYAISGSGQLTIESYNTKINRMNDENLVAGEYVVLSFTDTGCGIEDDIQEKIFDPFYSTKGEKGTGLGLSQVYGFVNRAGGAVKVDSKIGKGSVFTLYFPRSKGEVADSKAHNIEKIKNVKGNETILVVDDEIDLLDLTCTRLRSQGYTVYRAESAKQALTQLDTHDIDLVFSDIIMPSMNGYELASIISKKYPHIKIQLTSGFPGDKNIEYVGSSFSKNILHKPYNAKVLLTRIRTLLEG